MPPEETDAYSLWFAYSQGWFPMGEPDGSVDWVKPRRRALFDLGGIRLSRSMMRTLRKDRFQVTFDQAFEEVIRSCIRPKDNWLNESIISWFLQAHRLGWAHSSEAWHEGRLVGGVYGLALGTVFSAESMFCTISDASKFALWALVERCREVGMTIFDAQVMNPHLASLGAYEVPDKVYQAMLRAALREGTPWSLSRPEFFRRLRA